MPRMHVGLLAKWWGIPGSHSGDSVVEAEQQKLPEVITMAQCPHSQQTGRPADQSQGTGRPGSLKAFMMDLPEADSSGPP